MDQCSKLLTEKGIAVSAFSFLTFECWNDSDDEEDEEDEDDEDYYY
jgi:hypothetical protein